MKIRHYTHALAALVLLMVSVSAYGAWYLRVGKESATAISLATEIENKKQSSVHILEAKSQLEKAMNDEQAIQGYLVDTNDVVPFLESLQSIGQRLGTKVTVESVSAQPAKPHNVLQLSLKITGPFDNVERTLGAIEYQAYDTVVTNVTLDTPGPSAGAAPLWTAAVTLRIGTADVASTTQSKP